MPWSAIQSWPRQRECMPSFMRSTRRAPMCGSCVAGTWFHSSTNFENRPAGLYLGTLSEVRLGGFPSRICVSPAQIPGISESYCATLRAVGLRALPPQYLTEKLLHYPEHLPQGHFEITFPGQRGENAFPFRRRCLEQFRNGVRCPPRKRSFDGRRKSRRVERSAPDQKDHVDQVFRSGIDPIQTRQRVRVQLLGELLLPRNHRKYWWRDSAEAQPVPPLHFVQRLHHFVANPNVDVKTRKHSTVHPSLDRVTASPFRRSVHLLARFSNQKLEIVRELGRRCFLEHHAHLLPPLPRILGQSSSVIERQIDILRRSCGANPQLHNVSTLQHPWIRSLGTFRK